MPLEDPGHPIHDERLGHWLVWLALDLAAFVLVLGAALGVLAVTFTLAIEPILPPVPRRSRLALAEVATRHV
jgi:hypothetical protein